MVKVTIICLIYKSTKLLEAVYSSLLKNTPMLINGQAELIFIANDATNSVIQKLEDLGCNYLINNNSIKSEEELFGEGYGLPEYISRVYKGYNQGIIHAKSEIVVLINSDHLFSSDWLENLLKYLDFNTVVSSKLVERRHPKFGVFPSAIEKNFGESVENFDEIEFERFSLKIRKTGIQEGGAYMPVCMYKKIALYAGLYPEGNIAGKTKEDIVEYGDQYFFKKLSTFGVKHYTSLDSIVYHLKEGERESKEVNEQETFISKGKTIKPYPVYPKFTPNELKISLAPSPSYSRIMNKLAGEGGGRFI